MAVLAPVIGKWAADEWEELGDAEASHIVQAKRERLLIRFPSLSPKKQVQVDARVGLLSPEEQTARDKLREEMGG